MIEANDWNYVDLEAFVGETLDNVIEGSDLIEFHFTNGVVVNMIHNQDCCEYVTVEDVCGDWDDMLNVPITVAEVRTNENDTEEGHETWTFYYLCTPKGSVNIRWHGSSNGYYSESVDLMLVKGSNFEEEG